MKELNKMKELNDFKINKLDNQSPVKYRWPLIIMLINFELLNSFVYFKSVSLYNAENYRVPYKLHLSFKI